MKVQSQGESGVRQKRDDVSCFSYFCACIGGCCRSLCEKGSIGTTLGDEAYWDNAYDNGVYGEAFEWLQTSDEVWPYIEKVLEGDHAAKILHVGCGNSPLGAVIVEKGYPFLLNVDYSVHVIDMMSRKYPNLQWLRADCAVKGALGEEGAYDLCVDKGGIDALFESRTKHMDDQALRMLDEIHRVLRPGGKYLLFSMGAGGVRLPMLEDRFANVQCEFIDGYSMDLYWKLVFIYTCTK